MKQPPRTLILAGIAIGSVALLGVSSLLSSGPGGDEAGPSDVGDPAAVSMAPAGAPPGLSIGDLEKRYDPVLDAGLFTQRSFKPKPKGTVRKPREDRREPSKPSGPADISLRLTGVVGKGMGRLGVLEESGTGQGLMASAGNTFGETEIAAVNTGSLVILTKGKRRELALGETFAIAPEHRSALMKLRPKPAPESVKSGGKKPAIEISDTKRMSILERLKARRQASMAGKKNSDADSN